MAQNLNKRRMLYTRILVGAALIVGILGKTFFAPESPWHEAMEMTGLALVVTCAFGRIYASAFIGGIKNENLVTWGPYSLCRNPLYLFSLIGAVGLGLMTTSLTVTAVILGGFLFVYKGLIDREETFLSEKFGLSYAEYKSKVPRLWPKMSTYYSPQEVQMQTRYLNNAIFDAIWWFAPLAMFETMDALGKLGVTEPLFFLP